VRFVEEMAMLPLVVLQIVWPAALAGLAGLALAYFSADKAEFQPVLTMAAAFIGPTVLLAWASAAASPGFVEADGTPSWRLVVHWLVTALSVGALPAIAWRIRKQPHAWLFAPIAVSALAIVAVGWFFGTMAITGDWI
jgi:hypothetical protein